MEIFIYQTNKKLDYDNFFKIFKEEKVYYDWAWKRSREYKPYTSDIIGTYVVSTGQISKLQKLPEIRPIYLNHLETRVIFPEVTNEEFYTQSHSGAWNNKVCSKIEAILGEFV